MLADYVDSFVGKQLNENPDIRTAEKLEPSLQGRMTGGTQQVSVKEDGLNFRLWTEIQADLSISRQTL